MDTATQMMTPRLREGKCMNMGVSRSIRTKPPDEGWSCVYGGQWRFKDGETSRETGGDLLRKMTEG